MEKALVKTAIYSFITSYLLLLTIMPREKSTKDFSGMESISALTYPQFFFMVLKYSIIVTFIMVIVIFLYNKYKKQNLQ